MSRYQASPYHDGDSHGYGHGGYGGNTPQPYSDGYEQAGLNDGRGTPMRSHDYPMGYQNPNAASGSTARGGYAAPKKRGWKKWVIIGIVLICVIVAAVLGGVLGSRAANAKKNDNSGKASANDNKEGHSAAGTAFESGTKGADGGNTGLPSLLAYIGGTNLAAQTQTGANGQVYIPVATDVYMLPAYATGTVTAGLSEPTNDAQPGTNGAWPSDSESPSKGSPRSHPRLIAPKYKWDALNNGMIKADPYFAFWHKAIVDNATALIDVGPVTYQEDGGLTGSGVLDVARELKLRVKNLAYAYRTTSDTKFVDRCWLELRTASGNNPDVPFGNGTSAWNGAGHFLDLAEFTSAFAIGYDWLFDVWTDEQKSTIRTAIFEMGLAYGQNAYTGNNGGASYNWWSGVAPGKADKIVNGNWNCVCNAGLILGALAVIDEDQNGMAQSILDVAIGSSENNCFKGAYDDGTWAETANYWYFGTTGAAEMVSALSTAWGDDQGLAGSNPGFNLTSLYHIYAQGMTSLFNYGDHGPNKYSSTANSLLLWGSTFNQPRYSLYQRDHYDASEPFSMFWYDPTTEGAWWDGLPLDHHFDAKDGEWATARSSWSDNSGTYWAIKAGLLTGHQTHGDLDLGDFVFDAMGQRWAGELGSDQYLGNGYFSSEDPDSARWNYYRKRTEGQNTILINHANQNVNAQAPTTKFSSSGTAQGMAPAIEIGKDDSAFFTMDMSSAYPTGSTVKRGIRFLNGRQQMLLQDEVKGPASQDIMWRMHTNASVELNGATATLTLADRKCVVEILNPTPTGLQFSTMEATPLSSDTNVPSDEMPNPGVTVLVIDNADGGDFNVDVLFTPQWPDKSDSDYVKPDHVALDSWS